MSYLFDSSSMFIAIKRGALEHLAENYTLELSRYELSNTLWKEYSLHRHITHKEMGDLAELVKKVLGIMSVLKVECHEQEILNIAIRLRITFYDASYIYYAREKGIPFVTEDTTLIEKARRLVRALRTGDIISADKALPERR